MADDKNFYTLKGYEQANEPEITAAMEDYLEMICRLGAQGQRARIGTLAEKLHVKPSSASKMAANLQLRGFVLAPRYGDITLTKKGAAYGRYLLYRHDLLHRLLCMINQSENELEQVEKIEHFFDKKTVQNIARFVSAYEKAGSPPPPVK